VTLLGGLTENTGPEIDGPKKNNILKMSDMKMTDQITEHDFAGRENTVYKNAGQEKCKDKNCLLWIQHN